MSVSSIGQSLNVFFTALGDRAPGVVSLYAWVGAVIFVCSVVFEVRKQIKRRRFLYGFSVLAACVLINPLWFLPYGEFYQTVFLLIMVPLALIELHWKKLFTVHDVGLLTVPLWHWSLVYVVGYLNAA